MDYSRLIALAQRDAARHADAGASARHRLAATEAAPRPRISLRRGLAVLRPGVRTPRPAGPECRPNPDCVPD